MIKLEKILKEIEQSHSWTAPNWIPDEVINVIHRIKMNLMKNNQNPSKGVDIIYYEDTFYLLHRPDSKLPEAKRVTLVFDDDEGVWYVGLGIYGADRDKISKNNKKTLNLIINNWSKIA
jgi:hypothetical protein